MSLESFADELEKMAQEDWKKLQGLGWGHAMEKARKIGLQRAGEQQQKMQRIQAYKAKNPAMFKDPPKPKAVAAQPVAKSPTGQMPRGHRGKALDWAVKQ